MEEWMEFSQVFREKGAKWIDNDGNGDCESFHPQYSKNIFHFFYVVLRFYFSCFRFIFFIIYRFFFCEGAASNYFDFERYKIVQRIYPKVIVFFGFRACLLWMFVYVLRQYFYISIFCSCWRKSIKKRRRRQRWQKPTK